MRAAVGIIRGKGRSETVTKPSDIKKSAGAKGSKHDRVQRAGGDRETISHDLNKNWPKDGMKNSKRHRYHALLNGGPDGTHKKEYGRLGQGDGRAGFSNYWSALMRRRGGPQNHSQNLYPSGSAVGKSQRTGL